MTLKSVLRALQEVFPQIDLRILRAVAIEYSEDVDTAVEFILSDVLPIINEPPETSYAPDTALGAEHLNVGDGSYAEDANVANRLPNHDVIVEQKECLPPSDPKTVESELNLVADHKGNAYSEPYSDVILSGSCSDVLSKDGVLDAKLEGVVNISQTSGIQCDVLDSNVQGLCMSKVEGTLGASSDSAPTLSFQNFQINLDPMECGVETKKDISSCMSEYEESLGSFKDAAKIQDKCNFEDNCTVSAAFSNAEGTPSVYEISQAEDSKKSGEYINNKDFLIDCEVLQLRCLAENISELLPLENESVSVSDAPQTAVLPSQEGDIANVDFLDGVILDSSNRKRELESALESTTNMLKEVELHEEKAKQAKQEASMADQNILKKVEDLRQMIKHAKETNDKNAGVIYADKSTLASETLELQSRLLNIADEIEKSFSIIQEIQQTLDSRLAAAKEEQAAAGQEKLRKEDLAHKLLSEQQGIMDSMVQEANRLQIEADENARLRLFLMDRGCSLDVLQGDIALAYKSAMLLKNRVQGGMPDETISLVTTTLVSSASSLSDESALPGSVHHPSASENTTMIDNEPKDHPLECAVHRDRKEHSDDDWEMLEDEAE